MGARESRGDTLKLYSLKTCPYCRMVIDKLTELDLEYEYIEVPANRAERHEVVKVSGQPLVPVLVDGDRVLSDEDEIIAYLDRQYGKAESAVRSPKIGCTDGG